MIPFGSRLFLRSMGRSDFGVPVIIGVVLAWGCRRLFRDVGEILIVGYHSEWAMAG